MGTLGRADSGDRTLSSRTDLIAGVVVIGLQLGIFSFGYLRGDSPYPPETSARSSVAPARADTLNHVAPARALAGSTDPATLVQYAKTLKGVRYTFAGTDPRTGFDCSGFITYVFNHFRMKVPRSSVDFTNTGETVPLRLSRPGDLILFTGTDSTDRTVGHMGIVTLKTADSTAFIHATSGKAWGVTETPLNPYYAGRFVKVIRVLR